jgi:hypothetical protein
MKSDKVNCCDICVDPTCGGKKNCNCNTCSKKEDCYRSLKPTIRITRKCSQSCSHCCFECGPKEKEMMSPDMAHKVQTFMRTNNITRAETMGGEFFLNPDWYEVLDVIGEGLKIVRLVSNSDWAGNAKVASNVIEFLTNHTQFYISLSKDKWHTNKNLDRVVQLLKEADILHNIPTEDRTTDDTIVPIGRSRFDYGFFSMFGAYCSPGEKRYNFLIDEVGEIYKCGLGAWPYANVKDFQEGGFNKKFKEFNNKFYGAHVMNCMMCQRIESRSKKLDR